MLNLLKWLLLILFLGMVIWVAVRASRMHKTAEEEESNSCIECGIGGE